MPCRRCFRLGRQCDFTSRAAGDGEINTGPSVRTRMPSSRAPSSLVTTAPLDEDHAGRRTHVSHRNADEQAQRLEYLERIVQRHAGGDTPLDLDMLQALAETAERHGSPRPAVGTSSNSSNFDEVDKKITMQPLDGNVTRKCISSVMPAN